MRDTLLYRQFHPYRHIRTCLLSYDQRDAVPLPKLHCTGLSASNDSNLCSAGRVGTCQPPELSSQLLGHNGHPPVAAACPLRVCPGQDFGDEPGRDGCVCERVP